VVIGGTAGASYSKDGGASFASIGTGLTGSGADQIVADEDFATNGLLYCAGNGTTNAYRYTLDVPSVTKSAQWDVIGVTTAVIVGAGIKNGTLYLMSAAGCDRTLNPKALAGSVEWTFMNSNTGTAVAAAAFTTAAGNPASPGGNAVYTSNATTSLWSYADWLAVAKPDLTTPDNYVAAIDPVSGRGDTVTIAWKKMGTGTGLVNRVELEINEKVNGLTSFAPGTGAGFPFFSNIVVNGDAPNFTYGAIGSGATCVGPFRADATYVWRVRAFNEVSLDAIDSQWSDSHTINVQSGGLVIQQVGGPVLTGPTPGATGLYPGMVGFSWAPVYGATEYTIIVATDSALTKTLGSTPAKVSTPSFQVTGLEYGTTYFWAVQATKPTVGTQAIATFSTMAKPVATPTATAPPATQQIQVVVPTPATPAYIWAVIVIGAVLVIAVIILIVRTRRVP
jgi:hypothetical protein